jgi:hypothetical protein
MASAKGARTPWMVFKSIPSHASEPYNPRKMIHCSEISFMTTKFEYNLQPIRGPWSSGVSVPTLLSRWSTTYKIIRMIMSIKTLNSPTGEHYVNCHTLVLKTLNIYGKHDISTKIFKNSQRFRIRNMVENVFYYVTNRSQKNPNSYS